jgi:lysophospholipase L1-like esterase
MKSFLLILFSFLIFLVFDAQQGFSQKRIAVIGSSSAYGFFPSASGIPRDSAWAFKIKKHFKDLGIIDTLFNLGQNSTDCFEGMPSSYIPPAAPPGYSYRLPNPAINITKAVNLLPKPDVIIINYPTNNYDWIPNERVISCLQTIKDSANAKGIRCFITTTQPRDGFSPSERLKLKTLRDLILNQFGEWAIDFYTETVQEPGLTIKTVYSAGDGVHLNPAGHTVCKGKVLDKNLFFEVVPVRFSGLSATVQKDHVLLAWQTLNENGNSFFTIESSRDALHFFPLDRVEGAFNSTLASAYSYKDVQPAEGKNYYRIAAVSAPGQKQFSNIVAVTFKKATKKTVSISYSATDICLNFSETLHYAAWAGLYSMQGKLILTGKLAAGGPLVYRMSTAGLLPGNYILQLQMRDHKETFQVVKW